MEDKYVFTKEDRKDHKDQLKLYPILWGIFIVCCICFCYGYICWQLELYVILIVLGCYIVMMIGLYIVCILAKREFIYIDAQYEFTESTVLNHIGPKNREIQRNDSFYISRITIRGTPAASLSVPSRYTEYVALWEVDAKPPKNYAICGECLKRYNMVLLPNEEKVLQLLEERLGVSEIPHFPEKKLYSIQQKLDCLFYDDSGALRCNSD